MLSSMCGKAVVIPKIINNLMVELFAFVQLLMHGEAKQVAAVQIIVNHIIITSLPLLSFPSLTGLRAGPEAQPT